MHVKGTLPKLNFSQPKESKSSNSNSKEEIVRSDEDYTPSIKRKVPSRKSYTVESTEEQELTKEKEKE